MPTYRPAPTMLCYAPAKSLPSALEACLYARAAADDYRVGYQVYEVLAGRCVAWRPMNRNPFERERIPFRRHRRSTKFSVLTDFFAAIRRLTASANGAADDVDQFRAHLRAGLGYTAAPPPALQHKAADAEADAPKGRGRKDKAA